MKTVGLFSREDLSTAHNTKKKVVSRKHIDSQVALTLSPEAISRKMGPQVSPYTQEGAKALIIGFQADSMEDVPLSGRIASLTYEFDFANIPYALDAMVRTTKPPQFPQAVLAAAMTSQVRNHVAMLRPSVVVATHSDIVHALIPEISDTIANVRGRAYPARVGDHYYWVIATHDPRPAQEDQFGRMPLWYGAVTADARLATRLIKNKQLPDTTYMAMSKKDLLALGVYEHRRGYRAAALRKFAEDAGPTVCLDFETNIVKPWRHKKPIITAIAFSDGVSTISIPFDHPEFEDDTERDAIVEAFLEIIKGRRVVAHNVQFELWWLLTIFGVEAMFSAKDWLCTQAGAFVDFVRPTDGGGRDGDDKGVAGTSLDHQGQLHFGISIKKLSAEDSWDYRKTPLHEFLNYNALDAYFGFKLYEKQVASLKQKGLFKTFLFRNQRNKYLAWSTIRGFPVDQDVVSNLHDEVASKIHDIDVAIHKSPEISAFEKRFGKFHMTPDQIGVLMTKICKVSLGTTEKGRLATDKTALLLAGVSHPIAKDIVASREYNKAKSTYIDRLKPDHLKTYLGTDGFAHPQRIATRAVTGRHAHEDMNAANYPKRGEWYKIRGCVQAPKGWKVLSADLGQIEARIIAIISQDSAFRNAIIKGLDVHQDWAERLEKFDFEWYEANSNLDNYLPLHARHGKSNVSGLRGITKNKWVFPAFFGSGVKTLSEGMLLDPELVSDILKDHFWKMFAGVKTWHGVISKFYQKNFFVETLTGLRIHGPLTYNDIINYPVQGTASDILQNTAARLTAKAHELNRKWLVPWIDIHDDLSFFVPDKHLDWAIDTIANEMIQCPFSFIDIPITAELLVGQSWYKQEPVGVFSSDGTIVRH